MKLSSLLTIMVMAIAGLYAYDRYKTHAPPQAPELATVPRTPPVASQLDRPRGQQPAGSPRVTSTSAYTCDGRQHCSQMRSCAEATYFVQHCPNTKMDGDRDGIPCEDQWCN